MKIERKNKIFARPDLIRDNMLVDIKILRASGRNNPLPGIPVILLGVGLRPYTPTPPRRVGRVYRFSLMYTSGLATFNLLELEGGMGCPEP